jgi:uncharacterized protein (TIGR02284 family)
MTTPASTLNELIEITRDGQTFYTEAVTRVKSPLLRAVFHGIIDAKAQLIKALSEHVRVRGDMPSRHGTLLGQFRSLYTEVRAGLSAHRDAAYVAKLEESEDRLLEAFEEAAAQADDPLLRAIILRHLPKVRLCHEQMRNLKMSLAA